MINKLASLAKLCFNETEKESIKRDLQKMISFVQKMDEVDTSDVEPLLHISDHINNWREDIPEGSCSQRKPWKMPENIPANFSWYPK